MNEKKIFPLLSRAVERHHHWKFSVFTHWPHIIGSLKDKVILEKITDDTLILLVSHPSWSQELFVLVPCIKKRVNDLLCKEKIKHIRLRTGIFPLKQYDEEWGEDKKMQNSELENQDVLPYISAQEAHFLEKVDKEELRQEILLYAQRCKRVMQQKK